MTVLGETTRVTLLVTQVLEQLGISYVVGGSLASSLHGVMRATLDVDIVADMHLHHIPALVAALEPEFYADGDMMRDAIERRSSFNLIHYATAFKVDIFIRKMRLFDRIQFERRVRSVVAGDPEKSIYVTSPEDIILAKLEWYRLGGEVSDRQWRDILGVMNVRAGDLDLAYLQRWATELQVAELLERALQANVG